MNDKPLFRKEIIYAISHSEKWPGFQELWLAFLCGDTPPLYKHMHIPMLHMSCNLTGTSRKNLNKTKSPHIFPCFFFSTSVRTFMRLEETLLFIFLCSSRLTGSEHYLDVIILNENKFGLRRWLKSMTSELKCLILLPLWVCHQGSTFSPILTRRTFPLRRKECHFYQPFRSPSDLPSPLQLSFCNPMAVETLVRAKDAAQWSSSCLASMRCCVQFPALLKQSNTLCPKQQLKNKTKPNKPKSPAASPLPHTISTSLAFFLSFLTWFFSL